MKKHTEEFKIKMSIIAKKRWQNPEDTIGMRGKKFSEEHKRRLSIAHKGRKFTDEHRKKLSEAHKGLKHSEEHNKKIGKASKKNWRNSEYREKIIRRGKNNNWYIDGRSKIPYGEEFSRKLKQEIKKRDNYTCKECEITQAQSLKKYNQYLYIHHIDFDKTNNNLNNLITLCVSCHSKLHNKNFKGKMECDFFALFR